MTQISSALLQPSSFWVWEDYFRFDWDWPLTWSETGWLRKALNGIRLGYTGEQLGRPKGNQQRDHSFRPLVFDTGLSSASRQAKESMSSQLFSGARFHVFSLLRFPPKKTTRFPKTFPKENTHAQPPRKNWFPPFHLAWLGCKDEVWAHGGPAKDAELAAWHTRRQTLGRAWSELKVLGWYWRLATPRGPSFCFDFCSHQGIRSLFSFLELVFTVYLYLPIKVTVTRCVARCWLHLWWHGPKLCQALCCKRQRLLRCTPYTLSVAGNEISTGNMHLG